MLNAMSIVLDTEAESIISNIRDVFLGVCRGTITLHEAEVIDNYGSPDERAEARKLDTDERWEHIPDAHIEECTTALSHVDPESWRYYIAPYMIWSIQHFRTSNSIVSDFTIYTFATNEEPEEIGKYSLERYRLLDEKQSRCVCRFLRYMAKNGNYADDRVANEALQKYWGRFCDKCGT